jgi:Uma2 family endonuclease
VRSSSIAAVDRAKLRVAAIDRSRCRQLSSTAILTGSIVSVTLCDMAAISLSPEGFPMAPSQEVWDALDGEERARVVAELPNEVTDAEIAMPEGDRHYQAKSRTLDALRGYYARQHRRIYLAAELPIYYPAEPRFAPDLLAVLDVEDHLRDKWVVSAEGKGLDWVMEVHVGGDRKKDAERNVARYARLGIPEYFLYDRARNQLFAHRLSAPNASAYSPIVPQHGRYESRVLGLEVEVAQDRLRFFAGTAMLLESDELIVRLEQMLDQVQQRAEEEARRRKEAERELARLREELERLKR